MQVTPCQKVDATLEDSELAELLKVFAEARDQELSVDDVIASVDDSDVIASSSLRHRMENLKLTISDAKKKKGRG